MKIALFGAKGTIGQRILREAISRGHQLRVVVRDPGSFHNPGGLKVVAGDVLDSVSVTEAVRGQDAVISAIGPGPSQPPEMLVQAAHALTEGLERAGVKRLIVVGGAGSLLVAPGQRLMDTPEFPAPWKPTAQAHYDALQVYRAAGLDWTFISPADRIIPGERTATFRTGKDDLLRNTDGVSQISAEDYALALLDELEHPKSIRQRMTVAY